MNVFIELLRLRYLLLWRAATRTRTSFVLFALYHLFLVLASIMGLNAGATIKLMSISLGSESRILHAAMWVVFLALIASSIIVGIGMEGIFSAQGLRRFPLPPTARHLFSHLIAWLTPVWIGCAVFSLSAAAAFSISHPEFLLFRLPAALLFFLCSYTFCSTIASLLFAALKSELWLAGWAVALTLILVSLRGEGNIPPAGLRMAGWCPPGLFADVLLQTTPKQEASAVLALFLWTLFFTVILFLRSSDRLRRRPLAKNMRLKSMLRNKFSSGLQS